MRIIASAARMARLYFYLCVTPVNCRARIVYLHSEASPHEDSLPASALFVAGDGRIDNAGFVVFAVKTLGRLYCVAANFALWQPHNFNRTAGVTF